MLKINCRMNVGNRFLFKSNGLKYNEGLPIKRFVKNSVLIKLS
jgi:hypothetical protein